MLKRFSLGLMLMSFFLPQTVLANNQAKFNLVRKIYQQEEFSPYASPEFKRIIENGNTVARKIDEMSCENYEHWHLRLGNGGKPAGNLKLSALKNGLVRAELTDFDGNTKVDFDITCKANKCQVNDVFYGKISYKQQNEYIAKYKTCGD